MSYHKLWRITMDTNPEDCNLSCIMCEEHSPYSRFKQELYERTGQRYRRMSLEDIEQLFLQAKELGVKEVIPTTMGEPLLFEHIERIYELAKHYGIKINLTTNGTFPRKTIKEWAEIIVPNTTDVKISWNGATASTYEKIMRGGNFERNLTKLKEFIHFRDEYHKVTGYFCRITFQLTFMQNNMSELSDMIKLAASLGVDRVKGHHLWDHFNEIKHLSMRVSKESKLQWNKYVEEAYQTQELYRKANGEKVLLENIVALTESGDIPHSYDCPFLEKELWISAIGKISPCCAPDEQRRVLGDFGNVKSQSLQEVLGSSIYLDLVKSYKEQELCKKCNMRK